MNFESCLKVHIEQYRHTRDKETCLHLFTPPFIYVTRPFLARGWEGRCEQCKLLFLTSIHAGVGFQS